jgi:hypothetical protein
VVAQSRFRLVFLGEKNQIESRYRSSSGGLLENGFHKMNAMHPKFELQEATSGMYTGLKPLPKPPNVLSASRILRTMSADDFHPIGVEWNLFLTLGLARQNSSPPPFFNGTRPAFSGVCRYS